MERHYGGLQGHGEFKTRRGRHAPGAEHCETESSVGSRWDGGDDQWCELWGDARNEHGDVQRYRGDSDELELDEHCRAGAGGSDDGQRCCHGWRSGEQWRELYGHDSSAEYYELESYVGSGWYGGDDQWRKLRDYAGGERGEIQRDGRNADDVERDKHC